MKNSLFSMNSSKNAELKSTSSALGVKLSNFYQFQEITLYMSDSGWTIPVFWDKHQKT